MANPEHLKILNQGVKAWNRWRKENPSIMPQLSFAVLRSAQLTGADFSGADISEACLFHANLNGANLSNADLVFTNLTGANLGGAILTHTSLRGALLVGSDLSNAYAQGADISDANCRFANLTGADLKGADLKGANFNGADLRRTNLEGAEFMQTALINADLSEVTGLEAVEHRGPSSIGSDTLYKSQGRIPDKFLIGAGVQDEIIDIARSIRAGPPIQWHSCFISYSTKDEEFARRLHSRMREANMRVWFAPENLKGGRKLLDQIFEAIQYQDKLLLVLSDASILSNWVISEVRAALAIEKKENRRKLFPIRLTDIQTLKEWKCFDSDSGKDLAVEVREYFIPDFSNWKVLADGHPAAFESAFARLKKDLEAENSKKS